VRLPRVRYVNVLGAYLPNTVLLLVGATFAASLAGVVLMRSGIPFILLGSLVPDRVLGGELWRLVTWTFFELNPLGLIFGCLLLAWFGKDLSEAWGHWRFVAYYLGFTATIGAIICLLSLAWSELRTMPVLSMWPMGDALLVSWAIRFPHRPILVFMVIPVSGRNLIALTAGITALFAVYAGLAPFVPHFLAIGLVLALNRRTGLDNLWLRLRFALAQRRTYRSSALRAVPKQKSEPPEWLH
jgi:membrane associated rhomboid family serine protease